ncbi:MAG: alpha-amylase family glycosyl hydrolase [Trueperaceae bacterium]
MSRTTARLLASLLAAAALALGFASGQATLPAGALVYGPPLAAPPAERWSSDPGEGVYYQVFVRSFQDSDGDGIGDLRGLAARLPYLAGLGITGLWLTPIHPSPSYHGYDVTDYRGVHPELGTMADFLAFLDAAHRHGMRVVLDLVVNHSSDRHPWFVAARTGDGRFRDWYRFERDPEPLIGTLGGSAWHDAGDGTRYLGLFGADMPDLDHRNPEVVDAMLDVAAFWLDLGVDGFRIDAIQHVVEGDDGSIANAPANLAWVAEFGARLRERHPGAFLVGETWTSTPTIAAYHRDAGLDMSFDYPLWRVLNGALLVRSAIDLRAQLALNGNAYPEGARRGTFVGNHDQVRPASVLSPLRPNPARAALLGRLLLALPGTPFVYYGEELGMPNGPGDDDRQKRTPMRWTATEDGGFSGGVPWFPPSTSDPAISVEAQAGDPASVLEAYRSAIALRAAHPALARGGATPLRDLPGAVLAVWRTLAGEAPVLVLANLGNRDLEVAAAQLATPGIDARGLVPLDGLVFDGDGPGVWSLPANSLRLLGPAR